MSYRKRDRIILVILGIIFVGFAIYFGVGFVITLVLRIIVGIAISLAMIGAWLLYLFVKDYDKWKEWKAQKKRREERALRPKLEKPKPAPARRVKSKRRL